MALGRLQAKGDHFKTKMDVIEMSNLIQWPSGQSKQHVSPIVKIFYNFNLLSKSELQTTIWSAGRALTTNKLTLLGQDPLKLFYHESFFFSFHKSIPHLYLLYCLKTTWSKACKSSRSSWTARALRSVRVAAYLYDPSLQPDEEECFLRKKRNESVNDHFTTFSQTYINTL